MSGYVKVSTGMQSCNGRIIKDEFDITNEIRKST